MARRDNINLCPTCRMNNKNSFNKECHKCSNKKNERTGFSNKKFRGNITKK